MVITYNAPKALWGNPLVSPKQTRTYDKDMHLLCILKPEF